MIKRAINILVLATFLLNETAYGLAPKVASSTMGIDSPVRGEMYKVAQKRFAALVGPGALDEPLKKAKPTKVSGKMPSIKGVKVMGRSKDARLKGERPEGWQKNKILSEDMGFVQALEYFRDNEAKISSELLEIREASDAEFLYDREAGEIPGLRLVEYVTGHPKYAILVSKAFAKMWANLRDNDVLFEVELGDGKKRVASLAWAIFYRIAKHEMADIENRTGLPKSYGHAYEPWLEKGILQERELIANEIKGRYAIVNDAAWMWFLASYCFRDTTRYDNDTLEKRIRWFFNDDTAKGMHLNLEFPNLVRNIQGRRYATNLALIINNAFYSRWTSAIEPSKASGPQPQEAIAGLTEAVAAFQKSIDSANPAPLEALNRFLAEHEGTIKFNPTTARDLDEKTAVIGKAMLVDRIGEMPIFSGQALFTKDGNAIVAVAKDGSVVMLDPATLRPSRISIQLDICYISLTYDDKQIIAVTKDGHVVLLSADTLAQLRMSEPIEAKTVIPTHDGRAIIVLNKMGEIVSLAPSTLEQGETQKTNDLRAKSIALTDDNKYIIAIDASGEIIRIERSNMAARERVGLPGNAISVTPAPDGNIAIAYTNRYAIIINPSNPKDVKKTQVVASSIAFTDKYIIAVKPNGYAEFLDLNGGLFSGGKSEYVYATTVTPAPDGKSMILVDQRGDLASMSLEDRYFFKPAGLSTIINLTTGQAQGLLESSMLLVAPVELPGKEIKAALSSTGKAEALTGRIGSEIVRVKQLLFTKDEKHIVAVNEGGHVMSLDPASLRIVTKSRREHAISAVPTPNGKSIIAIDEYGYIMHLNPNSLEVVKASKVKAVSAVPTHDNKSVVAVDGRGFVMLLRRSNLKVEKIKQANAVSAIPVNDSDSIIVVTKSGRVALRNTHDLKVIRSTGFIDAISAVPTPDNSSIIVVDKRGRVTILDKQLQEIKSSKIVQAASAIPTPDGKYIVVKNRLDQVMLLDSSSLETRQVWDNHPGPVASAPDSKSIIAVSGNGQAVSLPIDDKSFQPPTGLNNMISPAARFARKNRIGIDNPKGSFTIREAALRVLGRTLSSTGTDGAATSQAQTLDTSAELARLAQNYNEATYRTDADAISARETARKALNKFLAANEDQIAFDSMIVDQIEWDKPAAYVGKAFIMDRACIETLQATSPIIHRGTNIIAIDSRGRVIRINPSNKMSIEATSDAIFATYVTLGPDGSILAVSGNSITLLNPLTLETRSGKALEYNLEKFDIDKVSVTPDSRYIIVVGKKDGGVKIIDTLRWENIDTTPRYASVVLPHPDNRHLIIVDKESRNVMLVTRDGLREEKIAVIKANTITLTHDKGSVIAVCEGGQIKLLNAATLVVENEAAGSVYYATSTPDDKSIIVLCNDGNMKLLDRLTLKTEREIRYARGSSVEVTSDNKYIIETTIDSRIIILDRSTLKVVGTFYTKAGKAVLSPNGKQLAIVNGHNRLEVAPLKERHFFKPAGLIRTVTNLTTGYKQDMDEPGTGIRAMRGVMEPTRRVARALSSTGMDGAPESPADGQDTGAGLARLIAAYQETLTGADIRRQDMARAALDTFVAQYEGQLGLGEMVAAGLEKESGYVGKAMLVDRVDKGTLNATQFLFTEDGKSIIAVDAEGPLVRLDPLTLEITGKSSNINIKHIVSTIDKKSIIAVSVGGQVLLIDPSNFKILHRLNPCNAVFAVPTPDGRHVVVLRKDGRVKLLGLPDLKVVKMSDFINATYAAPLPNSEFIVALKGDGKVMLLDRVTLSKKPVRGDINAKSVMPDPSGRHIIVVDDCGDVLFLNPSTLAVEKHSGRINADSIALDPYNGYIIAIGRDGRIILLDSINLTVLSSSDPGVDAREVIPNPVSKHIIAASNKGCVMLLDPSESNMKLVKRSAGINAGFIAPTPDKKHMIAGRRDGGVMLIPFASRYFLKPAGQDRIVNLRTGLPQDLTAISLLRAVPVVGLPVIDHIGVQPALPDREFPTIISDYIFRVGLNKGPGSEDLAPAKAKALYDAVNLLRETKIEIFLPQHMSLTDDVKRAVRDANKRHDNSITIRLYPSISHLKVMLSHKASEGVKRIMISEDGMAEQLGEVVLANHELFAGIRLINTFLPGGYGKMTEDERSVYQAKMLTVAILTRLYISEEGLFIKTFLLDMLKGQVDDPAGFIANLNEDKDMANPTTVDRDAVINRIQYYLGRVVRLTEHLAIQLRLMKEFWTMA